jgi:dihydroorotate dehydrogenase electron transfer subunit
MHPPRVKLQEDGQIIEQREVAMQTYRMRVRAPEIAARARAGQFAMLQVREGLDPLLRRPLSFHRIFPEEGMIEILYRIVGRGTMWLSRRTPGTRLNLLGPLGNGFELPDGSFGSIAVVAGGIGIAPLFELLARLVSMAPKAETSKIHLFYGARTAVELLPPDVFSDFGISVHWSTDDGSLGYRGYVPALLKETVEEEGLRIERLYGCGPLAMQYHVARWSETYGIPSQLSLESLMACGLGACLGCALPALDPANPAADHYVHVCKDGPIFPAGSIRWQKLQLHQAAPPTFLYS